MPFPELQVGELYDSIEPEVAPGIMRVRVAWVAGDGGVAARELAGELHGTLHRIVARNGDAGLASYDVELFDEDGADVLHGAGLAIAGEQVVERFPAVEPGGDRARPIYVMGCHQLRIGADQAGRTGLIDLYVLRQLRRDVIH